ncbi:50S ribosomal protein L18p (L5e) [Candidatus Nasuia deltocephalinicola]|nr:50S ribosomal protein L18p (L5e) [Candidatus Nasuia deltocephalinicola]
MSLKKKIRLKRKYSVTKKIISSGLNRISIYKSNNYIYCQIISNNGLVLKSVSSLDKSLKKYIILNFGNNININICKFLGKCLAYKALLSGFKFLAFDRSGYKYHGCIKMISNYSKKFGLNF